MHGPLAAFLAAHRDALNARFAAARHMLPQLDGGAFLEHLRGTLSPIADAVAADAIEKVEPVLFALYELSLDLVGRQLLGPAARRPVVNDGWRTLLPRAPRLLGREPVRLAGAVTNALCQLSNQPGARPADWIGHMAQMTHASTSVSELLACGQVAAWRAGMARYRESALATAAQLGPRLGSVALGLAQELPADSFGALLGLLGEDPWRTPESALAQLVAPGARAPRGLAIVAQAGAFRGFDGEFLRPPMVSVDQGRLVVHDGVSAWILAADIFGVNLVRCQSLGSQPVPGGHLSSKGDLDWQGERVRLHELAGSSSHAGLERTLAVTLPTSHRVFLVARGERDSFAR